MSIHFLKIEDQYVKDILTEVKTFEIRNNDRKYKVGDQLVFTHLDNSARKEMPRYTINYILDRFAGLNTGYVALGISPVPKKEETVTAEVDKIIDETVDSMFDE